MQELLNKKLSKNCKTHVAKLVFLWMEVSREGRFVVKFSSANLASHRFRENFLLVYFEVRQQIQTRRESFRAFAAAEDAIWSDDTHVFGFDVSVELEWVVELESALITNNFDLLFVIYEMILESIDGRKYSAANFALELHFARFCVVQKVVHVSERVPALEACVLRWRWHNNCLGSSLSEILTVLF